MTDNTKDTWETYQKLILVLKQHFPELSDDQAEDFASDIRSEWSTALWFENVERTYRTPDKDKAELIKAVSQIRRAVRSVDMVGWHGRKALNEFGTSLHKLLTKNSSELSFADGKTFLVEHLEECAKNISLAADSVHSDSPPPLGFVEADGPGAGAPQMFAARKVTKAVADVFLRICGKEGSYTTDPISGLKDGPIVQLLNDVFEVLGVKSSPTERVVELRRDYS